MKSNKVVHGGQKLVICFSCNYRPQTKFAKVMFSQVSVCLSTGGPCMAGGMCGREACMAGGHAWQGEHAWWGGMHGRWHAWWRGMHGGRGECVVGACMAGGMHGTHMPPNGYYEIQSMSGRYASYRNAFLLSESVRFFCTSCCSQIYQKFLLQMHGVQSASSW